MTNNEAITRLEMLREFEVLREYVTELDYKAIIVAINALNAIDEIIDYLHDSSVTWRDITDDIIADIVNKHMGEQK